MAFKFNPNAAEDRKYVSKAGTYTATVQASKQDYLRPAPTCTPASPS